MADPKILKSKGVTLSYLAELLKKADTKDTPLKPIQQRIKDFAIKFSKLNKDKEAKLIEEIKKLEIPRLTEPQIALIVNILPKTLAELKTIFAGSTTTITQENLEKIMGVLKKYAK